MQAENSALLNKVDKQAEKIFDLWNVEVPVLGIGFEIPCDLGNDGAEILTAYGAVCPMGMHRHSSCIGVEIFSNGGHQAPCSSTGT